MQCKFLLDGQQNLDFSYLTRDMIEHSAVVTILDAVIKVIVHHVAIRPVIAGALEVVCDDVCVLVVVEVVDFVLVLNVDD